MDDQINVCVRDILYQAQSAMDAAYPRPLELIEAFMTVRS